MIKITKGDIMEKERLQQIMMEFSIVHSYTEILRDCCEFNEDCRHIGLILPFLNYICTENKRIYNELDEFERHLFINHLSV